MDFFRNMTGKQKLAGMGILAIVVLELIGAMEHVSVENGNISMEATFLSDDTQNTEED